MNSAFNINCMEYMRTLPDLAFDLAVVDPPYGDGVDGNPDRFGGRFDRYKHGCGLRSGGVRGARSMETRRLNGTWHRNRIISPNYSGYRGTKLFGAEITSAFRLAAVSSFGASFQFRSSFQWLWLNTRGQV